MTGRDMTGRDMIGGGVMGLNARHDFLLSCCSTCCSTGRKNLDISTFSQPRYEKGKRQRFV